ncbi:MAG: C25 family cysteine peptidase, partial [Anaerolineae bacterium]|nr:C25 family cysteine peptidase [Anaerolineae bacterium]
QRTVTLVVGTPGLSLERTVTRIDNVFEVQLTLVNAADATLDVSVLRVFDDMRGFQVIEKDTHPGLLAPTNSCQYYNLETFTRSGAGATVRIDFATGGSPVLLPPGGACTVVYTVVPVLHEYTLDYNIGGTGTMVHYVGDGEVLYADSGSLNDAVAEAFNVSDYLIVTNPGRLVGQYGAGDDVDALLSTMAHLAQVKRGALGYLDSYSDKQVLDNLVEPDGYWTTSMYPDFKWIRKGYMLIVGEIEIVGAWTYTGLDTSFEDGDVDTIEYSDHAYSNTKGDGAPDLIVGRIIGNNPTKLRNAIRNSINVAVGAWEFDRSDALVVSGTGNGVGAFEDDVNDLRNKLLNNGWGVEKLHWDDDPYLFPVIFPQDFQQYDGFAAGDVIAGGKAEMVIAQRTGDHIIIRDAGGNTVGGFDRSFDEGDALAVGDVVGDSAAEIIIGDYSNGSIATYSAGGVALGNFSCGFEAFDGLATGYVEDGTDKARILYGSASADRVYVYDQAGVLRSDFWTPFDSHAGLASGDVSLGYGAILDEIIVGNANRIWAWEDDGSLVSFFDVNHTFEAGDRLAVGDVYVSDENHPEEIVIGDRNDTIYVYSTGGQWKNSVAVREFEYYDGLAVADVTGDGEEEILMADRDDQVKYVDAYFPRAALEDFTTHVPDKDLVIFRGHGNVNIWGPALGTGGFPLDFTNTKPVVLAYSCLTGNYASGDIAQSFFESGALSYLGATQVSSRDHNSNMSSRFLDNWGPTESVGSALTQIERQVWDANDWSSDMWEFWTYEYNLYGDPKIGTEGSTLPSASMAAAATLQAVSSSRTLNVPMYDVSLIDGYHHVALPGGMQMLAQGHYNLPYWTATLTYRQGTIVQDVVLTDRSGLTVTTGLTIPLTSTAIDRAADTAPMAAAHAAAEDAWLPALEEMYAWSVTEGDDGGVTLNIAMYPFLYNPATTDVRFYQDFTFDIQVTSTGVSIEGLTTDKSSYTKGEPVSVTLVTDNSGIAQDVIVEATIKAHPNRIVAGLPLRTLHDLSGLTLSAFAWDATGIAPGDYVVEVKLRTMDGDVLGLETQEFTLGITEGEVTALTATPAVFTAGDAVNIAMTFENTGTVPITGTAVIQVRPVDGITTTAAFTQTLTNLAPGVSVVWDDTWDTTGAVAEAYGVLGYVTYNSMASEPVEILVQTKAYIYLPLVVRNP